MWKERKKRNRQWHTFESARELLTSVPPEIVRPQLAEMLQAAEDIVKNVDNSEAAVVDNSKDSEDDEVIPTAQGE